MKPYRLLTFVASSAAMVAGLGCAHPYYAGPPPPPPVYAEALPIMQVADRNGFRTGEADGARDVDSGFHYAAVRTRAYHETPGYEPGMGPFRVYRDAFRRAYLRGYDKGFHRG